MCQEVQRSVRRALLRELALLDEQGEPLARLSLAEAERTSYDAAGEVTVGGEIAGDLCPELVGKIDNRLSGVFGLREADVLAEVAQQAVLWLKMDAAEEDVPARDLLLLGVVHSCCEGEIAELREVEPSAATQRVGDMIAQGLKHCLDVGAAQGALVFDGGCQFVVRHRFLLLKSDILPHDALALCVVECSNFKLYFHNV